MKRLLFWNSASGSTLFLINLVIAFVMSPFLVRTLGNTNYGLWDVILSVVGYMGLLDLGFGPALVRHVAVTKAQNDPVRMKTIISSGLAVFVVIGSVAFLVLATLSRFPDAVFGREVGEVKSISLILLLIGCNFLLQFPGTVAVGILMGLQRHYLVDSVRGILAIVQAVLTYRILLHWPGNGLVVLASTQTGAVIIQYVLFTLAIVIYFDLPSPSLGYCSWRTIKELWLFGMKNSILMLSSRLQKQSVPFIIARVLGLQNIVYYSIPNRLIEYARGVSGSVGFPLMPYFSALGGARDEAALKRNWVHTSLILQLITICMVVLVSIAAEPFIRIWIGAEYASRGRWVLRLLLVGLAVESVSPNTGNCLVALARHGRAALVWLVVSVVFIPVAIGCAYGAGLAGVALAASAAASVGSFWNLKLACDALGISIADHFRRTVFPFLKPAALLVSWGVAADHLWPASSYPMLIVHVAVGVALYGLGVWYWLVWKGSPERAAQLDTHERNRM